ncbi:hypothetical protein BC835DRAFT_509747 [Cytidiella melzeri]|nr:hypothetical protein BC835DRAFT_509747 [Cytidiella melzeri]
MQLACPVHEAGSKSQHYTSLGDGGAVPGSICCNVLGCTADHLWSPVVFLDYILGHDNYQPTMPSKNFRPFSYLCYRRHLSASLLPSCIGLDVRETMTGHPLVIIISPRIFNITPDSRGTGRCAVATPAAKRQHTSIRQTSHTSILSLSWRKSMSHPLDPVALRQYLRPSCVTSD